jgi:hypothetical protein
MEERVSENTRRATGAFLLIGVAAAAVITVLRQYSTAYMMIEPSREYALVAAFMVVGVVTLLVMMPPSLAVKLAFWSVGAAIVAAFAVAAAPRLGLIDHAPLTWRYVLLGAPKAKAGESERKLSVTFAETDEEEDEPKAEGEGKRPKEIANPESESAQLSLLEMSPLLETLTVFADNNGNRVRTAELLHLTPPGVSDRLRRLYQIEPDLVKEKAPEWVRRNIKD